MAIHTDRPGGGEDVMVVHRAKSADEARKVRAALEGAGVPVELPDQAIDAWFAAKTEELHVKVALKHWAKATKAIESAIPREPEPTPIAEAEDRRAAADAALKDVAHEAPVDKSKDPPSAVDKNAQRAFYIACISIFAPPAGLVAAFMGASVWSEMASRPEDQFRRKKHAQIATFVGAFVGVLGTVILVSQARSWLR
ncbi:MAG: hypothetical protein ACAI25_14175 [Planctomycetota bacterium]